MPETNDSEWSSIPKKYVNITFDADKAWVEWTFEVPVDADEAWIKENMGELWTVGAAICMNESGDDGLTIADVDMREGQEWQ